MRIPILIEPLENGRFRACAIEPFAISAEGATDAEATDLLTAKLCERMATGVRMSFIDVPNGAAIPEAKPQLPCPADNLYQTDPAFREWQEIIPENRRLETETQKPEA